MLKLCYLKLEKAQLVVIVVGVGADVVLVLSCYEIAKLRNTRTT